MSAVRSQSISILSVVIAVCMGSAVVLPAAADAADRAEVQMWSIRATHDNNEVSPELEPLVKTLKKTFKFTGYKLVKSETLGVDTGKSVTFKLPASMQARIKLVEYSPEKIKLDVHVVHKKGDKERNKLRTTFTLKPKKAQLFGGWKLQGDDLLILAVSGR